MDGEHIEMIISGWSSTELREKALTELGNMREELYVLRQLASGLTKRVPDVCPECAGSGKTGSIGLPRECPYCDGTGTRRYTQTVRPPRAVER